MNTSALRVTQSIRSSKLARHKTSPYLGKHCSDLVKGRQERQEGERESWCDAGEWQQWRGGGGQQGASQPCWPRPRLLRVTGWGGRGVYKPRVILWQPQIAACSAACETSQPLLSAIMCDDDVAALVVDNGSGMCKVQGGRRGVNLSREKIFQRENIYINQ